MSWVIYHGQLGGFSGAVMSTNEARRYHDTLQSMRFGRYV